MSEPWTAPRLHLAAGRLAGGDTEPVHLTPELVGLRWCGLRVLRLRPGQRRELASGPDELALLPLRGGCVVEVEGRRFDLAGRASVFEGVSDFAYVPVDAEVRVSAPHGAEIAVPSARAGRRLDPAYGPAAEVQVEVRGAGPATRQVNNYLTPERFPADKLVSCEVLTPPGNSSSYPPHKHDRDDPERGELVNEEIYYFRFSGQGGYGLYRQYAADGEFDLTTVVRDGDVFLVPKGYHGPSTAVPGHAMYFLNVLAGPHAQRHMRFRDDPEQHWVRATWRDQPPDPRLAPPVQRPGTGPPP